jgi:epsilon-lactone hydrolase
MLRGLRLLAVAFFSTLRGRRAHGPLRPTWSFSFEWIVRYLRHDWDDTARWASARLRADLDARPYPQRYVRKVTRSDGALGGVAVRRFLPPEAAASAAVLFFHGGSYVYGSSRTTHADLAARIALASKVEVVGAEYRLAPEHPYPAQLEDALAAFEGLVESGVTPDRIVVAGDSAGGNLALAAQIALRDRGGPQARAAVLISPWADLEMPGASFVDNDPYDYGTREVLVQQAQLLAGEVPVGDPRLSPVRARLDGLSPVFLCVGEAEIPRDDILALGRALTTAGVDVTLHVAKDMPHNAPVFAAYHPEGLAALEAIGRFVGDRLGSS